MISRKFLPRRSHWSKVCAAALVATSLAVGSSAFGQGYSTTFDEGTGTYPQPQGSLSGQGGAVPWDTNDPAKSGTASYVGQSDFVGTINYGGSTNLGNFSGYQGAVGGLFHGTGANQELPGSPIVYLFHAFSPGGSSSYVFNTDFDISFPSSGTTTGTPNTTRDSFGFNFQTSGWANLFSVNFTPDNTNTSQMVVGYTVNGVQSIPTPPTAAAILYNGVYHLRITVTAASMSINVTGTNSFSISNIPLTGVTTSNLQQVAATWTLKTTGAGTIDANGGYTQAGSNALIFDNFSIAVPEPSTWAMVGVGVFGLAFAARRRVRA